MKNVCFLSFLKRYNNEKYLTVKQRWTSSICHGEVMTCPNTQCERLLYAHVQPSEEWSLSLSMVDCRLSFSSYSQRQEYFWASFIKHKYHIVVPLVFWFWTASVMAENPLTHWRLKLTPGKKDAQERRPSFTENLNIFPLYIHWDALNMQLKVGGPGADEKRHGLASRGTCPKRSPYRL